MQLPESIYLQYMPDPAALDYLRSQQQHEQSGTGRPVPAAQIHLTILHFGYIAEVYQQLLSVNPALKEQTYLKAVQQLIAETDRLLPAELTVRPKAFQLFGPRYTVLALSCSVDPDISDMYQSVISRTHEFLTRCGIGPPYTIPHRPRALQIPDAFNPHITITKGHKLDEPFSSTKILPDRLRLHKYSLA